jgi:hypothetical protein
MCQPAALQGDLDMARAQATTAHDALKAVQQSQADRKARGADGAAQGGDAGRVAANFL